MGCTFGQPVNYLAFSHCYHLHRSINIIPALVSPFMASVDMKKDLCLVWQFFFYHCLRKLKTVQTVSVFILLLVKSCQFHTCNKRAVRILSNVNPNHRRKYRYTAHYGLVLYHCRKTSDCISWVGLLQMKMSNVNG